jgi:Mce-associated membrane protein
VSESDSPPSRRWRVTDLVLAELVVAVFLMAVAVAIFGARALPWTTAAERAGDDQRAATSAAQRAVQAFLEVDYRHIDDDTQAVIDLSTSPFRNEYAYGSTDLRVATMRAKSVSTATIRTIGLKDLHGDTARLLVGADTVLRTTATRIQNATKSCPHAGADCNRYRFLVTLTRNDDDRWLLSNLAEVP